MYFVLFLSIKVNGINNKGCYHEEYNLSSNNINISPGEKYAVPERKLTLVANQHSFLSQSFPPNCPISDETIIDPKELSLSQPKTNKFMSQFNLANKTDGVLRKRSNESKSDKVINDAGIDRSRSKSYLY